MHRSILLVLASCLLLPVAAFGLTQKKPTAAQDVQDILNEAERGAEESAELSAERRFQERLLTFLKDDAAEAAQRLGEAVVATEGYREKVEALLVSDVGRRLAASPEDFRAFRLQYNTRMPTVPRLRASARRAQSIVTGLEGDLKSVVAYREPSSKERDEVARLKSLGTDSLASATLAVSRVDGWLQQFGGPVAVDASTRSKGEATERPTLQAALDAYEARLAAASSGLAATAEAWTAGAASLRRALDEAEARRIEAEHQAEVERIEAAMQRVRERKQVYEQNERLRIELAEARSELKRERLESQAERNEKRVELEQDIADSKAELDAEVERRVAKRLESGKQSKAALEAELREMQEKFNRDLQRTEKRIALLEKEKRALEVKVKLRELPASARYRIAALSAPGSWKPVPINESGFEQRVRYGTIDEPDCSHSLSQLAAIGALSPGARGRFVLWCVMSCEFDTKRPRLPRPKKFKHGLWDEVHANGYYGETLEKAPAINEDLKQIQKVLIEWGDELVAEGLLGR